MYRLIIDSRINSVAPGNYIYPLLWRYKLCIWRSCDRSSLIFLLSTTNKMQRYTIFFIIVNALHVSGGFSTPSSGAQEP